MMVPESTLDRRRPGRIPRGTRPPCGGDSGRSAEASLGRDLRQAPVSRCLSSIAWSALFPALWKLCQAESGVGPATSRGNRLGNVAPMPWKKWQKRHGPGARAGRAPIFLRAHARRPWKNGSGTPRERPERVV